jgi:prolyl-tRNA synthetase
MKKKVEKPEQIPSKKNFGEWYTQILRMASILDTTYPVKGFQVWMPFGWELRNKVFNILRMLLEEKNHQECYFPLLIPESLFTKENKLARGFEREVYWVGTGGINPLGVKLAMRPTSEVPIYHMLSKWVRSYADLPLKLFQIVNTFRYETKSTKPLIRVREISSFKEAHTAHETKEEALKQIKEAIEIYKSFFENLGVPYLISKRPEYDKFPGSEFSYAFDTIFPDGRTLQIGTVHFHGTNFSKTFEITFLDDKGESKYIYTTCYGISERAIASLIAIHGDDHGLRLPPNLSPIQIVIIPIYSGKENEKELKEYISNLKEILSNEYKIEIDQRDLRPGKKYYEWELKGVPIRIEVGKRELEDKTVTIFRRDNFNKKKVKIDSLSNELRKNMKEIKDKLFDEAKKEMNNRIYEVPFFFSFDKEDAISKLIDIETGKFKGGIVEVPICNDYTCELKIANYVTILGEPLKQKKSIGKCICGEEATKIIRISKQY